MAMPERRLELFQESGGVEMVLISLVTTSLLHLRVLDDLGDDTSTN